MRATRPTWKKPVAMDGKMRARATSSGLLPAPAEGSSGHCNVKASRSRTPQTNTGIEMPSKASSVAV